MYRGRGGGYAAGARAFLYGYHSTASGRGSGKRTAASRVLMEARGLEEGQPCLVRRQVPAPLPDSREPAQLVHRPRGLLPEVSSELIVLGGVTQPPGLGVVDALPLWLLLVDRAEEGAPVPRNGNDEERTNDDDEERD